MRVYFHHNFGLISLAGRASVPLPSESGNYEFNVPTNKLLACKGMNDRLCHMQSYFLGTCFSEVERQEQDGRYLSMVGLVTKSTGTITIRVNVMKNYFNGEHSIHQYESESPRQRQKVKETVDEVLSRVRRNKRIRMSRLATLPSSTHSTERNIARRRSRRAYRSVESKDGDDDVADNGEETKRSDQTTKDALQNV